jgi:hypothetical protein
VAGGEERDGIDIALLLVPTVRVSGTVTRPDGQRAVGAQVLASPMDQVVVDPFSLVLRNMAPRAASNGEFSLVDLQPGRYSIMARASSQPPGGPAPAPAVAAAAGRGAPPPTLDLWASAEIVVMEQDIEGLALTLQPGMTIAGRVEFEGTTPPPSDMSRVSLRAMPPPNPSGTTVAALLPGTNVVAAADGSFRITGLSPGPYTLNAFVPGVTAGAPTWSLKSAVSGGRNVLDTPVTILPGGDLSDVVVTFTDKVTEVTGVLLDQSGRPAPEFYVIVFPVDATRWAAQSRWLRPPTRPATDGRYRIAGLPPGEYYLAALVEFEQNAWYSPAFLEQIVPGAIRITIGEGEKKTQDIKLN